MAEAISPQIFRTKERNHFPDFWKITLKRSTSVPQSPAQYLQSNPKWGREMPGCLFISKMAGYSLSWAINASKKRHRILMQSFSHFCVPHCMQKMYCMAKKKGAEQLFALQTPLEERWRGMGFIVKKPSTLLKGAWWCHYHFCLFMQLPLFSGKYIYCMPQINTQT